MTAAASPEVEVASSEETTAALVEQPWEVAQEMALLDRYLALHLGPRSVMSSSTILTVAV